MLQITPVEYWFIAFQGVCLGVATTLIVQQVF